MKIYNAVIVFKLKHDNLQYSLTMKDQKIFNKSSLGAVPTSALLVKTMKTSLKDH